jgi:hypothetical protein
VNKWSHTRALGVARPLDLAGPADYRIVVQGQLDASWAAQLEGLALHVEAGPPPITTLSGRLRDQAALHGVLRMLYALGLPLRAVILLEASEDRHD